MTDSIEISEEEFSEAFGDMDVMMEDAFEEMMSEYSMDVEGSIEDMLFEFFSSGFIAATVLLSDEEED